MTPRETLIAAAETFAAHGKTYDAEFARELALDCMAMEAIGFGSDLYRAWAKQLAERAAKLSERAAA